MRHIAPAAVLCALLAAAGCASRPSLPVSPSPETIRVQVVERGVKVVRSVPLEDYAAAAALSEFTPAAGDPSAVEAMFEVQAIIARTYAAAHVGRHAAEGFDLCSTTHCQLYDPARLPVSRWGPEVRDAIRRTAGVVVAYDGLPADAVYHADCGGRTSAASDVWEGPGKPYLISVPDAGAAKDAHEAWQYAIDAKTLERALAKEVRLRGARGLRSIGVVARDDAGRAERVRVRGASHVEVRGTDLRALLSAAFGPRSVRSTMFRIERSGARFVFSGRGFGHGVGLCQVGALARIEAGDSPARVLQHYYPGTTLVRLAALRTGRVSASRDNPYIMDGHDRR
jgi:stage II sporulation protein D